MVGMTRLPYNEDYFDQVDTEEKAYYLGLLLADGSRFTGRNAVSIDLQEPDSHILEGLRDAVCPGRTLKTYPNHGVCRKHLRVRLLMTNRRLSESLEKLGMVLHKSTLLGAVVDLEEPLRRHLVRGYFDGDGSAYRQDVGNHVRLRVGMRGTEAFLRSLLPWLPVPMKVRFNKQWEIYTSRHFEAMDLCEWMYEGATVFLGRKHQKYSALVG
jgi:hypothetical protein